MTRTYTELISLPTFEDRFEYLQLNGSVGVDTFGYDRYLNQVFYHSKEWRKIRDMIIIRDNACDLAVPGHDIFGRCYIHHLNPIAKDDVVSRSSVLLNPENLVCVSYDTHQAIHYGDETILSNGPIIRKPNDTCPWRIGGETR